jgi:hypothetical protein
MEVTKSVHINLTESEVKDIIREYLHAKGHEVSNDNIEFTMSRVSCGFGINEVNKIHFHGCKIRVEGE